MAEGLVLPNLDIPSRRTSDVLNAWPALRLRRKRLDGNRRVGATNLPRHCTCGRLQSSAIRAETEADSIKHLPPSKTKKKDLGLARTRHSLIRVGCSYENVAGRGRNALRITCQTKDSSRTVNALLERRKASLRQAGSQGRPPRHGCGSSTRSMNEAATCRTKGATRQRLTANLFIDEGF